MTMDIKQAAQLEYKARMRERLAGMPMPLDILMQSDEPITQANLDAIQAAKSYLGRDQIPEVLLPLADTYNELTGQEANKRVLSDWIDTLWQWKDEKLSPEDIRGAWAQSKSDRGGFVVGRPAALTNTAVGVKSKSRPALPVLNKASVEATQELIAEKQKIESAFVPMPQNERDRIKNLLAQKKAGVR